MDLSNKEQFVAEIMKIVESGRGKANSLSKGLDEPFGIVFMDGLVPTPPALTEQLVRARAQQSRISQLLADTIWLRGRIRAAMERSKAGADLLFDKELIATGNVDDQKKKLTVGVMEATARLNNSAVILAISELQAVSELANGLMERAKAIDNNVARAAEDVRSLIRLVTMEYNRPIIEEAR